MLTAKILEKEDGSQILFLPEEIQFDCEEVIIQKVGDMLIVAPNNVQMQKLLSGMGTCSGESEYAYKVVIELDDEKLAADDYDVEDAYRVVKKMFTDKEIDDISEGKHLAFATNTEKGWSAITANMSVLWRRWAKPYLKVMKFYDIEENDVEDAIEIYSDFDRKENNG